MLAIAILAAGKGTRMKSSLPKVMQELAGLSLIERVLKSSQGINPDRTIVIVGHESNKVKSKISHLTEIEFVEQIPQKGTGHAIQQLIPILNDFKGNLLVLNGDVPLLTTNTIKKLVSHHSESHADVSILSARTNDPKGYGRVFADENGKVSKITEERDCSELEKENNLTNAGVYCFNWLKLREILPTLSNINNQNEIYLTDAIAKLPSAVHLETKNPEETCGINDKQQLSKCEQLLQEKMIKFWMREGVKFINPSSCTLSESCKFGKDIVVEPETHIRGNTIIGDNCIIGPNSYIQSSRIGDNSNIFYSVIKDSVIGENVNIGPYSHIRPNSNISNKCKIGNFVEVKNSILRKSTKANHLSYIGDSDIGEEVNIGAGTITANFDGKNKNKTMIGAYSKTGANSVLIAPVEIGERVTIGAGSTITQTVPSNSLAISRSKQIIKENWSLKRKNIKDI